MPREKKHKFSEDIENYIGKIVVDQEYTIAKAAKQADYADFDSLVEMLECHRNEKDYDWMSDIFLPELPSILLTDASGWASQYFQTRDFVEVKLEGNDRIDIAKCRAAKKCLNQTLNHRRVFHYPKYMRARTINGLNGQVYAIGWWEKKVIPKIVDYENRVEELDIDIEGNPITNREIQQPATRVERVPIWGKEIQKDHFNYEIIHPQNLFTDSRYCYSPQDKDWITVRSEKSYEELKALEVINGYFNLDLVKNLKVQRQTETAGETYDKGRQASDIDKPIIKRFDNLLRFGKFWAIVKQRDEDGNATLIVPGYDRNGEILKDAELIETIVEFVVSGSTRIMIRFQPTPFIDSRGNPYKPIARGWCYIHPTKDVGLSDGKNLKEIQVAINDAFNMGADRVKLATIPTMKGKKNSLEDNPTIYFAPEHVMELESPEDVVEFKIEDNIEGTLNLIGMLKQQGQQVSSVYPHTMGELPAKASTTATAVAGAESRSNIRENYKSLTFEYTFLIDFYWMILQMVYAFAEPETADQMMGEDAQFFDPNADYNYSPVSSNIETEYNKYRKLQMIDQFVGRLVALQNPKIIPLLNYLMAMAFELFGKEFPEYKKYLLDENAPPPVQPRGGQNLPATTMATSNQYGTPQTAAEQYTRGGWR